MRLDDNAKRREGEVLTGFYWLNKDFAIRQLVEKQSILTLHKAYDSPSI